MGRVREGPAADTLAALPGPFDLVFLDADRASYRTCLELAVPRLAPGGLLVADNVVSHRAELEDFLARVKGHPGLLSVTVPVGKGEEVAFKLPLTARAGRAAGLSPAARVPIGPGVPQ